MISPLDDQAVLHNRLTHSEKVAQIARSIAKSVLKRYKKPVVEKLGGLSPTTCEAAGLVHDLGHPPFGHVAEKELQKCLAPSGFQRQEDPVKWNRKSHSTGSGEVQLNEPDVKNH